MKCTQEQFHSIILPYQCYHEESNVNQIVKCDNYIHTHDQYLQHVPSLSVYEESRHKGEDTEDWEQDTRAVTPGQLGRFSCIIALVEQMHHGEHAVWPQCGAFIRASVSARNTTLMQRFSENT